MRPTQAQLTSVALRHRQARRGQVRVQVVRHVATRLQTEVARALQADVDADGRRRTQL